VTSLEEFDKLLKEFNPNLLVIGGLQMMDNYPYPNGKMTTKMYICLIIVKNIAVSTIKFYLTPSGCLTTLVPKLCSADSKGYEDTFQ
jgi:hypothetical protein